MRKNKLEWPPMGGDINILESITAVNRLIKS
uniref:Uncharacterized protein n=1 Tax=Anguilla anguilla TaxID=7936 RepID=A0A0E9TAK3_ANGAN